jgi:dethiobiotin synthetase
MFLITGTDTGVGKTYFTAALVKAFRKKGFNALAYKPVETGCRPECSDAKVLGEASGAYYPPVYSFKLPLAPAVAAEVEGVRVNPYRVVKKILELKERYSPLLVEGAGGLLVPITWNFTYLNLAKELQATVIVVALNKLGVLNHTLLTCEVLRYNGVKVGCVVLNYKEEFDESVKSNLDSLRRLLPLPVYPFSSQEDAFQILNLV